MESHLVFILLLLMLAILGIARGNSEEDEISTLEDDEQDNLEFKEFCKANRMLRRGNQDPVQGIVWKNEIG